MNDLSANPRPHRLLIVDNDRDCADAVCELLRQTSDWDIEVAYDGQEALLQARLSEPDVVLLDLEMPGMTGFQTADGLLQADSVRLPRLVGITGNSNLQAEAAHDLRFHLALLKPADNRRLLTLLAGFVAADEAGWP